MAKAAPTAEDWLAARHQWEDSTDLSLSEVGKKLGVSRAAVHKRYKAEGWIRNGGLKHISDRAHLKADAMRAVDGLTSTDSSTGKSETPDAIDQAENLRAAIIDRQRGEIDQIDSYLEKAKRAYARARTADARKGAFEFLKAAKITSEILINKHRLQRQAWGISSAELEPDITIKRSYAEQD